MIWSGIHILHFCVKIFRGISWYVMNTETDRYFLPMDLLVLMGTITGGMTSTPGLAAADSMTDSNIPGVAYATVYPIAMVLLIVFVQIIASVF